MGPSAGDTLAQTFRDATSLLDVQSSPLASLFGASIVDINSDGLVDIYQASRMYIQQPDGTFRHTMQDLGIDPDGYIVFGGLFADTDDDGFLEIFFMDLLSDSSRFYANVNGLWYQHTNQSAGIEIEGETQGSIFADFNGDGPLDLFVGEERGGNQLFRGSTQGTFLDVTDDAGIVFPPHTYGAAAADFDNDGDLDIFIAACSPTIEYSVNLLLQNQGDGTFVDVAAFAGVDDDLGSWGVVWLDYDADGLLDAFIANAPTLDGRSGMDKLYHNLGNSRFEDVSLSAGVAGGSDELGIGAAAADFDNDGWIDLYVANLGFPSRLYMNNRDGTFSDRAASAGVSDHEVHRSVAVGDIDGDGWIDLFAGAEVFPFNKLLFNEGGSNTYLKVSLRGSQGNGFGIGARLKLYSGGILQMRDIMAGDGMTSQNHALTAHFGLGASQHVDSLIISWPSSRVETYSDLGVNQHITFVEENGQNNAPGTFSIESPADGATFAFFDDVTVTWTAPQDDDELSYTLTVMEESGRIYYEESGITATTASIPGFLTKMASAQIDYTWTISATDGFSVRRATQIGFFSRVGSLSTQGGVEPESFDVVAYPVPTSGSLSILYGVDRAQVIEISVIDILGRVVIRADAALKAAGKQEEFLDGSHLTPGVYFVLLEGERSRSTTQIVIAR